MLQKLAILTMNTNKVLQKCEEQFAEAKAGGFLTEDYQNPYIKKQQPQQQQEQVYQQQAPPQQEQQHTPPPPPYQDASKPGVTVADIYKQDHEKNLEVVIATKEPPSNEQ